MKELTKKVVILNNFTSPYVAQAIIVFKDYNPKLEGRAIEDAEKIVSNYIDKIEKNGQPQKAARKKGKYLKIAAVIIIATVIYAVIKCLI